jgi:hypothetical protein
VKKLLIAVFVLLAGCATPEPRIIEIVPHSLHCLMRGALLGAIKVDEGGEVLGGRCDRVVEPEAGGRS